MVQAVLGGTVSAERPRCGHLCCWGSKERKRNTLRMLTFFSAKLLILLHAAVWIIQLICIISLIRHVQIINKKHSLPIKGRFFTCIKSLLQLFDKCRLAGLPEEPDFRQALLPDEVHTLLHHERCHVVPIATFIQHRLLQPLPKHTLEKRCKGGN